MVHVHRKRNALDLHCKFSMKHKLFCCKNYGKMYMTYLFIDACFIGGSVVIFSMIFIVFFYYLLYELAIWCILGNFKSVQFHASEVLSAMPTTKVNNVK